MKPFIIAEALDYHIDRLEQIVKTVADGTLISEEERHEYAYRQEYVSKQCIEIFNRLTKCQGIVMRLMEGNEEEIKYADFVAMEAFIHQSGKLCLAAIPFAVQCSAKPPRIKRIKPKN